MRDQSGFDAKSNVIGQAPRQAGDSRLLSAVVLSEDYIRSEQAAGGTIPARVLQETDWTMLTQPPALAGLLALAFVFRRSLPLTLPFSSSGHEQPQPQFFLLVSVDFICLLLVIVSTRFARADTATRKTLGQKMFFQILLCDLDDSLLK
ncbi:MAG: hypothetical protein ACYTDU_14625 [Planctomycetota bacterium]